jgi:hypothetical protein
MTGAPDELIANEIEPFDSPEGDQPDLWLAHDETDCEDYHTALPRLFLFLWPSSLSLLDFSSFSITLPPFLSLFPLFAEFQSPIS